MNPDEFRALIARIGQNLSNQALVTELLSQASEAFETTHTAQTSLSTQLQEQSNQITELQKTNMNLFLKVANPVQDTRLQSEKPLSYDDLITEFEK